MVFIDIEIKIPVLFWVILNAFLIMDQTVVFCLFSCIQKQNKKCNNSVETKMDYYIVIDLRSIYWSTYA